MYTVSEGKKNRKKITLEQLLRRAHVQCYDVDSKAVWEKSFSVYRVLPPPPVPRENNSSRAFTARQTIESRVRPDQSIRDRIIVIRRARYAVACLEKRSKRFETFRIGERDESLSTTTTTTTCVNRFTDRQSNLGLSAAAAAR